MGRRRGRTQHGALRSLLAIATCILVTMVAACARIPTSGPVFKGATSTASPASIYLRANKPPVNGSPEQIVTGFLSAETAGVTGGFGVAREFLTSKAAGDWDPTKRVVVYQGDLKLTTGEVNGDTKATVVHGTGTAIASIDQHGLYSEASSTPEQIQFALTKVKGQWRISGLDDGIVMSSTNFVANYRPTTLYFPTSDLQYLVPDVRWFPKPHWQSSAVSETLAGPSPYLAKSVATTVPDGTALAIDSVTVSDDGPIDIPLNQTAEKADKKQLGLLTAQLEAELSDTMSRQVTLYVGDNPLLVGKAPALAEYSPSDIAVGLSKETLVKLGSGSPEPVPGIADLSSIDPTAVAFSGTASASSVVLRSGENAIVTAPTKEKKPVTLMTGKDLVAPSVDRFDLVWSGPRVQNGSLTVAAKGTSPFAVSVPWLAGRTVQAIRVAPDGARIAVVSSDSADVQVDVAGVVRNADGIPTALSDPLRVGPGIAAASQVVWIDSTHLGILGSEGGDSQRGVLMVPVTGPTTGLNVLEDPASLAAVSGTSSVLVGTDDDSVYSYGDASLWSLTARGVRLPSYSG